MKQDIMTLREGMKGYTGLEEDRPTDQELELPQPPLERVRGGDRVIPLPRNYPDVVRCNDFLTLLERRRSRRVYWDAPLRLEDLAFLLWATQGVKRVSPRPATLRTVPSAGARHPLETYVFAKRVEGLVPGVYHYLAIEHKLELLYPSESLSEALSEAFCGQTFFGSAPVSLVWTAVPYRSEWRYDNKAQKYALLDAGHVCQNLYLACEAIGCGACAIGAYHQAPADALLHLPSGPSDSKTDEFVIYAASVGRVADQ